MTLDSKAEMSFETCDHLICDQKISNFDGCICLLWSLIVAFCRNSFGNR